jgi:hypothetical protein
LLRGAEKGKKTHISLFDMKNGSTGILNKGEEYWILGLFFSMCEYVLACVCALV